MTRILQVVGRLGCGGTEAWLMQVLRRLDPERFQMDFLVFQSELSPHDDEIRSRGSRILVSPPPGRPFRFAPAFDSLLKTAGPYDIVHSHIHFSNGVVMRQAAMAGVSRRIAHSHMGGEDRARGAIRAVYRRTMRRFIRMYATHGLGCSSIANNELFGTGWTRDGRIQVLHCGIDLTPFAAGADRTLRAQLGIPEHALVVGHVGRFAPQKNHRFLLAVIRELAGRDPNIWFLLVGDGVLRPGIEKQTAELGLTSRVVFTGNRGDVPKLMLSAMDAFVLPSVHEGLGLVAIEAQAAGLPCVLSDVIPRDVQVLTASSEFCDLSLPPSIWASRIVAALSRPRMPAQQAIEQVKQAGFSARTSVRRLAAIYAGGHTSAFPSDGRREARQYVSQHRHSLL